MPATEAIEISMLVTFPGPPPWGSDLRSEAVSARARILGMHAESLLRRRRNSNSGGTRRNYKKEKKRISVWHQCLADGGVCLFVFRTPLIDFLSAAVHSQCQAARLSNELQRIRFLCLLFLAERIRFTSSTRSDSGLAFVIFF